MPESLQPEGIARCAVVIAPVNRDDVLGANLAASPCIVSKRLPLVPIRGAASAARAYNEGIDRTTEPVLVFAHQDVLLPPGWDEALFAAVDEIERTDPGWGVIGLWGIVGPGRFAGRVYCNGAGIEHVGAGGISRVASIDEIVIIVRRASGLRFDEGLPGFHMYATDLCLHASEAGMGVYAIEAPIVHNSDGKWLLDRSFWDAYRFMRRKWSHRLPIQTCVVPITPLAMRFRARQLRIRFALLRGRLPMRSRHPSPLSLAQELGYDVRLAACARTG